MLADRAWNSHDVSTALSLGTAQAAGLCFAYRDEGNHYRLEAIRNPARRVVLTQVADGVAGVVAETPPLGDAAAGDRIRLRAVVEENVIRAYVNGSEALPATWDSGLSSGRAGLCVGDGEAVFAEFAAVPLEPFDRSVVGATRTFSHEKSMANWASSEGEWLAATGTVGGSEFSALWHRADVPGDGGISMRIPQRDPAAAAPARIRLFYSATPEHPDEGYTVVLSTGSEASGDKLELRRSGGGLAGAALPVAREARTLRLQRVGCAISVWLDGQPVLHAHDRAGPPAGLRAGWCAEGVTIGHDQVSVFSRNVHLDDFRTSPVDWRAPAGTWDVTVRWECDPRWSFFSGRGGMFAASNEKLAAIWHKRSFPGDFTIEFTVGQKMAREFGAYADYTRDFNVTVCGDGRDLTSGYTCTFGGWADTKTAIVRGRDIVAETDSVLIPRSNSMHRRWFNIKVRRRASRLSFLVDDEIVLEYDDPEPLPGARVALWTYDNGFMISRFRVSTEETGLAELPGTARGVPCRSFYDP